MELKEKIKNEIDSIPEEYLPQVERYLEIIKSGIMKEKRIRTLHLKGIYDNLNIRRVAYE